MSLNIFTLPLAMKHAYILLHYKLITVPLSTAGAAVFGWQVLCTRSL